MATDRLRVLIFGAGEAGRRAFARLTDRVDVLAIVDNDPSKHGSRVMGVSVINPKAIADTPFDCIVVASLHSAAIVRQLLELGVSVDDIELPPSDEHFTYESRWIATLGWGALGGATGAMATALFLC